MKQRDSCELLIIILFTLLYPINPTLDQSSRGAYCLQMVGLEPM